MQKENLGPAERIIQTLLQYTDHMVHHRPGIVVPDGRFNTGVRWDFVTTRRKCQAHRDAKVNKNKETKSSTCSTCGADVSNGPRVVYRLTKVGKKTTEAYAGILEDNGNVTDSGRIVGRYQEAGLFPVVAAWMYKQVAEVWRLDNEFAARWASFAYKQDHRDLKVILAAFMLCQSRKGDPVCEDGKVVFWDTDLRDVGEAMLLLEDMNPKQLLLVHEVLSVPEIAEVNRTLGFGRSARRPTYGRYNKVIHKWLAYREKNPKVLKGLVKAGFRTTVMRLAQVSGYKPESPKFFETLRWKQKQSDDGRRSIAIGAAVKAAENWEGLTEEQVCERVVRERPDFKRLTSLVPKTVGLTRAVVAAAIEAGSFSDKDLIIFTPTLEELGLLKVQDIKSRWEAAMKKAEDMRAANIATRVKSKEVQEKLQETADTALKAATEEVMKNIRLYVFIDISGSMTSSIPVAKSYIEKFLQAFPPDRLHVAVFTTSGREVKIPHPSAAGVRKAFEGISAGGGTDYGSGVRALQNIKPAADEDVLFIFVGDEEQWGSFASAVRASRLSPMAFGMIQVPGGTGSIVHVTAAELGIPCIDIDNNTFSDVYAIPRTIRNLIASTPVGHSMNRAAPRVTLVEQILKTDLLKKPAWAA